MSFVIFVCDFSGARSEKSSPVSAYFLKCQRRTMPGEMSESGTPAALRCTAQCIPQLTKLREALKSCAKCCAASKNPATTLAKLVDETISKRARSQAAQTVLSSPPAMPSNLSQRSGASLNEARIQTPTPQHNVNRSSRRPDRQERSYSSCKNRSGKPLSATLLLHRANDRYQVCRDRSSAG